MTRGNRRFKEISKIESMHILGQHRLAFLCLSYPLNRALHLYAPNLLPAIGRAINRRGDFNAVCQIEAVQAGCK